MFKFILKLLGLIILVNAVSIYMDIRDYNNIVTTYPQCAYFRTPKEWHYNGIQKAKYCYGLMQRRQSAVQSLY